MRKGLYKLIRWSGLPLILRNTIQRKKVTILLFHDITIESAEKSFRYLKSHYNIISLDDLVKAIKKHEVHKLPSKSVVLTFDDGHKSNIDLLPLIKELQIPITIFLCSSIVGTSRGFWFRSIESKEKITALKAMSNRERLEALEEEGFVQDSDRDDIQALQDDDIMSMLPYVDFHSHSCFHPILPQCSDDEAWYEIQRSKQELESRYGQRVRYFSYPNGDYSQRDRDYVQESGYECGVTVEPGYNDDNTDLFALKRFSVNDTGDLSELIVKASGCMAFLKKILGKKTYGERQ